MNDLEILSNLTWGELGEPISPSVFAISGWLENNISKLNILIDEEYICESGNFSPIFSQEVSGIYKDIYFIKYYSSQLTRMLNGITNVNGDSESINWISISENGQSISRANPNVSIKTYKEMRDDAQKDLNKLIATYKANQGKPQQIAGDDALWIY